MRAAFINVFVLSPHTCTWGPHYDSKITNLHTFYVSEIVKYINKTRPSRPDPQWVGRYTTGNHMANGNRKPQTQMINRIDYGKAKLRQNLLAVMLVFPWALGQIKWPPTTFYPCYSGKNKHQRLSSLGSELGNRSESDPIWHSVSRRNPVALVGCFR